MPYVLDDDGLEIPPLSEILQDMLAAYVDPDPEIGFGPDADVSEDSPFYIVASPAARQLASCWQGLRELSGQFDPTNASGQQLDRLGSMIGLLRRAKTRSLISGRLVGTPGTVVPANAVVRYNPNGTLWQLPGATISESGVVEVDATAIEFGAVDARKSTDWSILSGIVPGLDAFESRADAQLGALAAGAPEYRAAFREAAMGLATYDAVVGYVRRVSNVTNVYAYVNPKLALDPVTGLLGKQWRFVFVGGAKNDIINALHKSLGAPVDTVGAVTGTVSPGNGQVLTYAFDRLKRRRGYLRLTYTGSNPNAPLPEDAEERVFAAVAAVVPTGGQPFNPMIYGAAGLVALFAAVPGCVTKLKAEGRLSTLDAWQEDAIAIGLDEVIDIATEPTVAEALSTAEDPMTAVGGSNLWLQINGGPAVESVMPAEAVEGSENIAAELQADFDGLGVVIDSDSGRVRFRTELTGSGASLGFPSGTLAVMLGLELLSFEGSDGDLEVVLIP